jgi:hypothetical protein
LNLVIIGDVGLNGYGSATEAFDKRHCFFSFRLAAAVVYDHIGTFAGKQHGRGTTDSCSASGD